jgi:hypothetical protein
MQITRRNIVFIIVSIIFSLSLLGFCFYFYPFVKLFYIIKTSYSETRTPWAYVLPINKEFKKEPLSETRNSKIEFEGINLIIPWVEASKRFESSIGLIVFTKSANKKSIIISNKSENSYKLTKNIIEELPKEFLSFLESKNEGKPFSEYDLLELILRTTPDQIGLGSSLEALSTTIPLLIFKSVIIIDVDSIFIFKKNNLNYIQYGTGADNRIVSTAIYKDGSNPSVIKFIACSQEEIETTLSNLEKD